MAHPSTESVPSKFAIAGIAAFFFQFDFFCRNKDCSLIKDKKQKYAIIEKSTILPNNYETLTK